jgi:predicted nucleic acid-binding protein
MRTALDSNILSCLWSNELSAERVQTELRSARSLGGIVICAPVYVELVAHPLVSIGFVDRFLAETAIAVEFDLDELVWRKTAEGFTAYVKRRRRSGGASPKRVLPDFIIAAHALLRADRLLTLDPARYRRDFPELQLA